MLPGSACVAGRPDRGYALLAVMIAVGVVSAASMTVVTRWSDELRREREQELLRIGDEIAGAIARYHRAPAGMGMRYPPGLEDLLSDRRSFGVQRYLRRIEPDPMTKGAWGVLRAPDGGVMGVYSTSTDVPMRQVPVALRHTQLQAARRYSDWKFVAVVPAGDKEGKQ